MKTIKIRFTSWRGPTPLPRSPALQEQINTCSARISVLSGAAARIREEQAHADSKMLQKSLARIIDELDKIGATRTSLLSAEEAEFKAAVRAEDENERVGTFGYQIFNKAETYIAMTVDEAGNYLPAKAQYTYEVIDEDPPQPPWAKDGKFGH
ncbi:MAG TPA: hypothetical protein VJT81_20060 [Burkholderiales bacterium]|nr:hypothetical protein [Burkholderiales bacterium]